MSQRPSDDRPASLAQTSPEELCRRRRAVMGLLGADMVTGVDVVVDAGKHMY